MKRIAVLLLVCALFVGLCAAASAEEWVFDRGVTIVCPWGEGGGADSTIRPLSELLSEYESSAPIVGEAYNKKI